MGRKKQFIDKKKSATFQLMARDTSDPNYSPDPSGDRVFVRVDNNDYVPDSFNEGYPEDADLASNPNSIFADAPEDSDDVCVNGNFGGTEDHDAQLVALPEKVRKEILELGFPDDGYNYLSHLREIKNTGGGSAYYHNRKANFIQLPRDIKAYDASRVDVSNIKDVSEGKSIHSVASKTVGIRLQKALDPEVAAMLDDSASSKYDSDIEDLEEDFVLLANLSNGPVGDADDEKLIFPTGSGGVFDAEGKEECDFALDGEKPRAPRPLDQHFDLLELQEYGTHSEDEEEDYDEDSHRDTLKEKLDRAFKDLPSGILHLGGPVEDDEPHEPTAEVIQRCREYAKRYETEGDDLEEVLVEESGDEAEAWDCETIVTTYSNLDNHPGKIGAPEARKKKKMLADGVSGEDSTPAVIALKGKERLPVDFLPRGRKNREEKVRDESDASGNKTDGRKWKPRSEESKEEKKERKDAVKLERREARQLKKETKSLYKSEARRAQKVAAFTGPSSIHLM